MAVITGHVLDFGLDPLYAQQLQVSFVPSGNAITSDSTLLAVRPVSVVPDASGRFSIDVATTEDMRPQQWYEIQLKWLDGPGSYTSADFPKWKVQVPAQGGSLNSILNELQPNASMVWVGEDPPENPEEYVWWLIPSTGDLYEWGI